MGRLAGLGGLGGKSRGRHSQKDDMMGVCHAWQNGAARECWPRLRWQQSFGIGARQDRGRGHSAGASGVDMGLNLLDTAAAYGTEALIGKAIKTVPRDRVVITTKALINRRCTHSAGAGRGEPRELPASARHRLH